MPMAQQPIETRMLKALHWLGNRGSLPHAMKINAPRYKELAGETDQLFGGLLFETDFGAVHLLEGK
jgi:hypothetical protein